MKFQFKIQPFQTEAVNSVVRVFEGQPNYGETKYRRDIGSEKHLSEQERLTKRGVSFAAMPAETLQHAEEEYQTAYRNADLELSKAELLKNIRTVQLANNIIPSTGLADGLGAVSLDIEMETGTGKTYVYIKTMFELYEKYGWGKFIVVVPSVAIREGVKKSFEITQEHFMSVENYGLKARFFVYNSSNLHQLDEFSQNAGINVMIINTQAFNASFDEEKNVEGRKGNKEARIIYEKRDEFGSRRPIDVIKANRPIIILDEPQKMGGAATQNALKKNFNPLFSLHYSATHKTSHNLVYVLDALDAYTNKLVKKIEVKGFELKNIGGADCYLYLASIRVGRETPRARLEYEKKLTGGTVKREIKFFDANDSLYTASNELEQYKGISISEIDPRQNIVTFSNGLILAVGEATGNANETDIRRIQIRETIASHLEKEEKLFEQGVKCLSLFFIDEVAKYRQYGEGDEELLGEYGRIFEEEYTAAINERPPLSQDSYEVYLRSIATPDTHKGYFSIDKGRAVNSKVKRGQEFSDDTTAYDLILKNKEQLLSFEEPTRFIFSHSALREGWDNPNVFQICTLKQSDNVTAKRQEVGRGLRLCVNEAGERQDVEVLDDNVHNVNMLTVIASESYAGFVSDLQREIKSDLYERPTVASEEYFAGRMVLVGDGTHTISPVEAKVIYNYLIRNDYVDDGGAVTDIYRNAVETDSLAPLKQELAPYTEGIHKLVQAIFDPSILADMIGNGHDAKVDKNPIVDANWEKFKELWLRINKKYAYTVKFKSDDLIKKAIEAIDLELRVSQLSYTLTTGKQEGAEFNREHFETKKLKRTQKSHAEYDLIGKIAAATTLTRKTVTAILNGIHRVKMGYFGLNPEEFIAKVSKLINEQKAAVVVANITYTPTAEEPYTQEIFNISRSSESFVKALKAKRAITEYVFTDGISDDSVERRFAENLEIADEVVVYAKLPSGRKGFQIPTPVGNYSPDWAISFKKGSVKHIFFIAETKGTMDSLSITPMEKTKILCARKLFNEISTEGVKYYDVDSYESMLAVIDSL